MQTHGRKRLTRVIPIFDAVSVYGNLVISIALVLAIFGVIASTGLILAYGRTNMKACGVWCSTFVTDSMIGAVLAITASACHLTFTGLYRLITRRGLALLRTQFILLILTGCILVGCLVAASWMS